MANMNVRNLPDEVHRAIRIQAAHHGRSTEAEIRDILERAAKPEGRVKLGSLAVWLGIKGLLRQQRPAVPLARQHGPAGPLGERQVQPGGPGGCGGGHGSH